MATINYLVNNILPISSFLLSSQNKLMQVWNDRMSKTEFSILGELSLELNFSNPLVKGPILTIAY